MVGRIAFWKGQHVFLEAFARAFGSGSEVAVVVGDSLFGDDEARYGAGLREMTRVLDIAGRVDFRGFRNDVWKELAGMDILVHASVTPEPFGQVVVEAMLAGVPVIAAAGGGPNEILTSGVDGLLYPAGDVDALVEALTRLRHDAQLRVALSNAARVSAARFSPQVAASSLMELYANVWVSRDLRHRRRLYGIPGFRASGEPRVRRLRR
jgi:glycosyltransferase involved in cell wall biosynthesis